MALLKYVPVYWGRHTKSGMTENVKMLALELLNKFDEHTSAQLLLLQHYRDSRVPHLRRARGPKGFTGSTK